MGSQRFFQILHNLNIAIMDYEMPFDEYNDFDTMSCIDDYNRYEEEQVFLDNEYELEDQYLDSYWEDQKEMEFDMGWD